jgi:GMP reductase
MHIEETLRLDFKDVLIRPKRSTPSRAQVDLNREFVFHHSGKTYNGIPIIAANMDSTGTIEMARALEAISYQSPCTSTTTKTRWSAISRRWKKSTAFYSMGITQADFEKFSAVMARAKNAIEYVCIDVANGYTEGFINFVKGTRHLPSSDHHGGNVVTGAEESLPALILSKWHRPRLGLHPPGK